MECMETRDTKGTHIHPQVLQRPYHIFAKQVWVPGEKLRGGAQQPVREEHDVQSESFLLPLIQAAEETYNHWRMQSKPCHSLDTAEAHQRQRKKKKFSPGDRKGSNFTSGNRSLQGHWLPNSLCGYVAIFCAIMDPSRNSSNLGSPGLSESDCLALF